MAQSSEAIRAYASLLVQATIPLILGSFKSLKVSPCSKESHIPCRAKLTDQTPESTKRLRRDRQKVRQTIPDPDDEDAYEDESAIDETLTWADTLIFPVFGSVALMSLWLVIKYAGREWINLFLGVYCELLPAECREEDGKGLMRCSLWSWDVCYPRCKLAGPKNLESSDEADGQTLSSIIHWVLVTLGYKPSFYHIRISSTFKRESHLLNPSGSVKGKPDER